MWNQPLTLDLQSNKRLSSRSRVSLFAQDINEQEVQPSSEYFTSCSIIRIYFQIFVTNKWHVSVQLSVSNLKYILLKYYCCYQCILIYLNSIYVNLSDRQARITSFLPYIFLYVEIYLIPATFNFASSIKNIPSKTHNNINKIANTIIV